MNEAEIREAMAAIEAQFGPWTGGNIPLGYGINSMPQLVPPTCGSVDFYRQSRTTR
jgi:hypothetical protein